MRLKSVLFCFSLVFPYFVQAQNYDETDACYEAVLRAEQQRDFQIYTQCGFDDANRALIRWSSWVVQNNAYQAMYELCVRYPNTQEGVKLCQTSAMAGNGPALLLQANQFYDQKKYIQALQSYTQALKSPLLTEEEKGQVSEKIGILYLDKSSPYYNPQKGWPLIERATQQRSALANNIVGVYSMLGLEEQKINLEKAFEHLWRSVLLGCPNAEENLGLFYLLHEKKITPNDLKDLVGDKILTCQNDIVSDATTLSGKKFIQTDCDCGKTMMMESLIANQPYRLILVDQDNGVAVLKDSNNRQFSVSLNKTLPDGYSVAEIRKTAVVLMKNKMRQTLNLAPDEGCVEYCSNKQGKAQKSDKPDVKPYRLTFTPSECSSILYYAERLVDTNLPFVGKQECGFSNDLDTATQLLLQ